MIGAVYEAKKEIPSLDVFLTHSDQLSTFRWLIRSASVSGWFFSVEHLWMRRRSRTRQTH